MAKKASEYIERLKAQKDAYKEFFIAIWAAYCDQGFDMDSADTVIHAALKAGLAVEEHYDPAIHGEALGDEWGLEPGDTCYVLATLDKATGSEAA